MKQKYTIAEDGFVGYWHPANGHKGNFRLWSICVGKIGNLFFRKFNDRLAVYRFQKD